MRDYLEVRFSGGTEVGETRRRVRGKILPVDREINLSHSYSRRMFQETYSMMHLVNDSSYVWSFSYAISLFCP